MEQQKVRALNSFIQATISTTIPPYVLPDEKCWPHSNIRLRKTCKFNTLTARESTFTHQPERLAQGTLPIQTGRAPSNDKYLSAIGLETNTETRLSGHSKPPSDSVRAATRVDYTCAHVASLPHNSTISPSSTNSLLSSQIRRNLSLARSSNVRPSKMHRL